MPSRICSAATPRSAGTLFAKSPRNCKWFAAVLERVAGDERTMALDPAHEVVRLHPRERLDADRQPVALSEDGSVDRARVALVRRRHVQGRAVAVRERLRVAPVPRARQDVSLVMSTASSPNTSAAQQTSTHERSASFTRGALIMANLSVRRLAACAECATGRLTGNVQAIRFASKGGSTDAHTAPFWSSRARENFLSKRIRSVEIRVTV